MMGQETKDRIIIDSSSVAERSFNDSLAEKYTGDDFDYEANIEGEAQNFIARAIQWFFQKISELFGIELDPETYRVIEFFVYFILIGLALYLVVKLLVGNNAVGFFRKKSAHLAPLNVKVEDIKSIDLDKLIKDALQQKDYRLAVRFMYLKALKDLSAKNIIHWDFDKTNADYQREIEDLNLKRDFQRVSYLYDFVWYGEFEIGEQEFAQAQGNFDRFTQNLRNAG